MASEDSGRTLTTDFRSIGTGRNQIVDNPRAWFSRSTYRKSLNAKQNPESTARRKSKDFTPSRAAVIGQWVCLVLGVVCVVCGAFGIFARQMEGSPSASAAWLGSAYMPTLRVTALLCLSMGLLLVRRGWSRS
jgi:hypothetical protein